jgi:TRAP-type C4-dicarboxylate transport system permease small subunit
MEQDINTKRGGPVVAAHRLVNSISHVLTLLGGLVLFGMALTVTLSVCLSALGFEGIPGDFELVGIGCVIAISLFLPQCQIQKSHIMVDLFTNWLPLHKRRILEAFWQLVFAAAWIALLWLTTRGMLEKLHYDDRSMLLGFPVWLAYVPAVLGLAFSAIAAIVLSIGLVTRAPSMEHL